MELIGAKGLVTVNAFKQNLTVYAHSRQRAAYAYWGSDANRAMIEEFVAAIQEKRTPRVTGEDGLRAVEVVAAAYESVATGMPV